MQRSIMLYYVYPETKKFLSLNMHIIDIENKKKKLKFGRQIL